MNTSFSVHLYKHGLIFLYQIILLFTKKGKCQNLMDSAKTTAQRLFDGLKHPRLS